MKDAVTVSGREALADLTVAVRVRMGWRATLGLWLMNLGARLAGVGSVEVLPNDPAEADEGPGDVAAGESA